MWENFRLISDRIKTNKNNTIYLRLVRHRFDKDRKMWNKVKQLHILYKRVQKYCKKEQKS